MTMPTLNADVLLRIAYHLKKRDLESLCLVSQYMNVLIQPVVFSKIEFFSDVRSAVSDFKMGYRQFRRRLQRSPDLARHARDVTLEVDRWDMQDMVFILLALTGKGVSRVCVTDREPQECPGALEDALTKFLRGTRVHLEVTLVDVRGSWASSLGLVRHLALVGRSTLGGKLSSQTIETVRLGGSGWHPKDPFRGMECLTHFLLDWVNPDPDTGPAHLWYRDLEASLICMPRLELLTVMFKGMSADFLFYFDTHSPTTAPAEGGWEEKHQYVRAYVSRIQNGVTPRRLSLEWRFVSPREGTMIGSVESYVRCLEDLTGWNTIAFQLEIKPDVRLAQDLLGAVKDTLLNRESDNHYVRIDEVYLSDSLDTQEKFNRSTLLINKYALQDKSPDAVERRVHEDVCPLRLSKGEQVANPKVWIPCGRKWKVEEIWVE